MKSKDFGPKTLFMVAIGEGLPYYLQDLKTF